MCGNAVAYHTKGCVVSILVPGHRSCGPEKSPCQLHALWNSTQVPRDGPNTSVTFDYNMIDVFFPGCNRFIPGCDRFIPGFDRFIPASIPITATPLQFKCTFINKMFIVLYFDIILSNSSWDIFFHCTEKKKKHLSILRTSIFLKSTVHTNPRLSPYHLNATGCRLWSTGSDRSQSCVVNGMQDLSYNLFWWNLCYIADCNSVMLWIYSGRIEWTSFQIRNIVGCVYARNAGNVFPTPRVSDPDMHHGTWVTHVPWCMPGSLTSGSLWSHWWWKTFPAFPAHAQPAIFSGKRSMAWNLVHPS